MNRVIKFRGKSLDNGEWVYGHYADYIHPDCGLPSPSIIYLIPDYGNMIVAVDPETVGQFTGKIGRNGKEIYEGDIVVFTRGLLTICKWINGWYLCYEAFVNQTFNLCALLSSALTVVGNIHDNPDLLKGVDQ